MFIFGFLFLRYPAPPAASGAYGQPVQSQYNSMAPPPTQQLTNQMTGMNLGNYGRFPFFSVELTDETRQVIMFVDCSIRRSPDLLFVQASLRCAAPLLLKRAP